MFYPVAVERWLSDRFDDTEITDMTTEPVSAVGIILACWPLIVVLRHKIVTYMP